MDTMISTPSGRIILRVPVVFDTRAGMLLGVDSDAVAVFGAVGDWAAYVGARELSDEEIHRYGVKLRAIEAAPLFPFMNIGSYRP